MKRGSTEVALLVLGLAAVACHGPLDLKNEAASDPAAPAWTRDVNLAERTTAAADVAARVWGGKPSDLDGWTINYVGHIDEDDNGRAHSTPILGGGTITLNVFASTVCSEATALAHEVGHVIIGDGDHTDRRWHDGKFNRRMTDALAAVVPETDVDCLTLLATKGII
jgi:hypothetical protein